MEDKTQKMIKGRTHKKKGKGKTYKKKGKGKTHKKTDADAVMAELETAKQFWYQIWREKKKPITCYSYDMFKMPVQGKIQCVFGDDCPFLHRALCKGDKKV